MIFFNVNKNFPISVDLQLNKKYSVKPPPTVPPLLHISTPFKGTVSVVSSDPPCKDGHSRFTPWIHRFKVKDEVRI